MRHYGKAQCSPYSETSYTITHKHPDPDVGEASATRRHFAALLKQTRVQSDDKKIRTLVYSQCGLVANLCLTQQSYQTNPVLRTKRTQSTVAVDNTTYNLHYRSSRHTASIL